MMMMWWWAKSNWLSLSLSQLLKSWFLSPMTFKDPNSLQTVKPPPLLPAWMPTEAHVDAFSQATNRPEDLQYCLSNLLKRSVWSVCLIDHPTTIALPEIAVRDYLFGEPHLFLFFKWPYLSLKKWDTWGQMGVGMFPVCFLNFLCISMLDTVFVTEDTGHLSFSAFSWWSLYYVKASVP